MEWAKLGIGAILYAIASQAVHVLGALADMPYYTDPANAALWSKVMMPGGGAPGPNFTILSIIISLITGLIFGMAYVVLKQNFKQSVYLHRGLSFGIFLFILVGVPSFLTMAMLFAIPFGLQISWLVQALIVALAGGIAFAKYL